MTADLGRSAPAAPAAAPGTRLGDYTLGAFLWKTTAADVYKATGSAGPVAIHIVHPAISSLPAARDAIIAAATAASKLPEHKHVTRTIGGGVSSGLLYIVTEDLDGNSMRDLLARKRDAGSGGFGARGAGNLIIGIAGGLVEAGIIHGALGTESIVVNRSGRVRVADLALGPGVAAAIAAGKLPAASHIAPEVAKGAPTPAADVYALGAILYEALVGRPLERGGPRPSEAVPGLTSTIDELIARACARDPDKRFGSIEVMKELVADALGRGGAVDEAASPASSGGIPASLAAAQATAAGSQPSLAQALSSPGIPIAPVDPALASALADSNEKWLVAKGRLDYGPFSLADVVEQIRRGEIVAGNVIIDKDTGGRAKVDEHPLLGPIVDAARHEIDHKRRAEAEVEHQSSEKKRGVVLYLVIAMGVLVAGLAVWFLVTKLGAAETKQVAGVDSVGGAKLDIKISAPKKPPPQHHTGGGNGGGHHSGGGGNNDPGDESLSLDLSGDDDATETLDMQTIYGVYARRGGDLGGCLQRTGSHDASISIIIDGHSGRVNWVRVNGQSSGGLFACINGVMRSMQFPTVNGPRTRAEFDLSL